MATDIIIIESKLARLELGVHEPSSLDPEDAAAVPPVLTLVVFEQAATAFDWHMNLLALDDCLIFGTTGVLYAQFTLLQGAQFAKKTGAQRNNPAVWMPALRSLDPFQLAELPGLLGGMVCALLAEGHAEHGWLGGAASILAQLCGQLPDAAGKTLTVARDAGDAAIENLAGTYLELRKAAKPVYLSGDISNMVRVYMAIARKLWDPGVRLVMARVKRRIDWSDDLSALAWAHMALHQLATVTLLSGFQLKIDRQHWHAAWNIVLIYDSMTREQARFLIQQARLPPADLFERAAMEKPAAADLRSLAQSFSTALLRDAHDHAAFAPYGGFVLALPQNYPLRDYGITALRVWAEAQTRMWVFPEVRGQVHLGHRWNVNDSLNPGPAAGRYEILMALTAAALWRDLCVAGETVIRPRDSRPGAGLPKTRPAAQPANRTRVQTLPRPRVVFSGPREWGDAAERAAAARQAHAVRGHLRRLQADWHASAGARELAEQLGLIVPDGFTFVRPHARGLNLTEKTGAPPAIVKARGLATVLAALA